MSLLPASSIGDESTGFYNGVATQSLRMNFGDSSYLYYTPSTGDRFTGTYSTWYKGSGLNDSSYGAYYFNAYGSGSEANFTYAHIANDFQLAFDAYGTSYFHSNALFRDETNWYNIVWVWDTPNGTQNKRQRAFVNGVEVTSMASGTRSGIRQTLAFGGNHQHTIFANYYNGNYDSYASGHHSYNVYVNGHALDPTAFGQLKNGVWIPKDYATKPSLIAQDTGTAIGDLTAQGGLAGAFNGTRFQATSSGASTSGNVSTAYIGKNWGSSKTITGFILYSPTSDGFVGSGGSTFTVKLYGKNGAPSSGTDGTLLFTSSSVNDNLVSTNGERGSIRYFVDTTIVSEETISSFTTTAFTYHWVLITPNSSTTVNVGQIEFYEDGNNYFGTGGFRLDFNASDLNTTGSSRTDPYGSGTDQPNNTIADASGSGNHLTKSTNVASTDFVKDNPENNFCVLNTVGKQSASALSEGNLKTVITSGTNSGRTPGTFAVNSGKWYWEVRQSSSNRFGMGVFDTENYIMANEDGGVDAYEWVLVTNDNSGAAQLVNNSNYTNGYGGTVADGHVVMVALDCDNDAIWFGKQGSWFNTDGSSNSATVKGQIEAGTTTNAAFTSVTGRLTPSFIRQTSNNTINVNFGQDDTFAGNETTAGNTDSKGKGEFQYEPPSGFLALCSDNLPDLTISPAQSTQATDHFNTILYTGDGNDDREVTGVGFQPDWVWIKNRSNAGNDHILTDSSRGGDLPLNSNGAYSESTQTNKLESFASDGFVLGQSVHSSVNANSNTYVAWNWKANGGTTTTNDASSTGVGTIDSVYQANTTAGFSIVLYTGTGSEGTVAHGLSSAPEVLFIKNRTDARSWVFGHVSGGFTGQYTLNTNGAFSTNAGSFNDTAPTSTVVNVNTDQTTNESGDSMLMYCFHSVEGYSKFGSFVGNNLLDGPFIYTGFRPAWILAKRSDSTSDWFLLDNKRSPENVVGGGGVGQLAANQNYAESSLSTYAIVDFLSNGFKMRSDMNYGYWNASGGTYIYMAFAEQPFKFSNAR